MMARLLSTRGHEVRSAADGHEALGVAREFAPDCVVMDLGLPGLDGLEVARRLRALPEPDAVTLIALTGRDDHETRRLAETAGFRHYLVKPIGLDDLEPHPGRVTPGSGVRRIVPVGRTPVRLPRANERIGVLSRSRPSMPRGHPHVGRENHAIFWTYRELA